jgi:hypothetical protein
LLDNAAYRLLAIISSNGLWKAAGTGFVSDSFLQSHQSCYILLQNIQERFSIRLFQ